QGLAINARYKTRILPARLQLPAKDEIPSRIAVVKWLDSQPVAHQKKFFLLAVPQRQGEHAHKPAHCLLQPPALDGCQHHFGVGMAPPVVAGTEFFSYLLKVVNLSIEDDGVAPGR